MAHILVRIYVLPPPYRRYVISWGRRTSTQIQNAKRHFCNARFSNCTTRTHHFGGWIYNIIADELRQQQQPSTAHATIVTESRQHHEWEKLKNLLHARRYNLLDNFVYSLPFLLPPLATTNEIPRPPACYDKFGLTLQYPWGEKSELLHRRRFYWKDIFVSL